MAVETIKWSQGAVKIIDQTKLPAKLQYIYCRDVKTLWKAIRCLSVRGAPALGVAAGFGVLLGLKNFRGQDRAKFLKEFDRVSDYIATSRPTAVNLFNVLDEMKRVLADNPDCSVPAWQKMLKKRALEIYEEDRAVCRKMGDHGARLIRNGNNVMTVCNAGALATVDYGTALGVFYSAHRKGKNFRVFACETRPLLQGARLTAWELTREKIDTTLICDSMAASVMRDKSIDAIFTGADRIAANGDAANKIGTYSLAVLAKHHHIPFYVVAPRSTFDFQIRSGRQIPIEQRAAAEVKGFGKTITAPNRVKVFNPAFDVTPARLITAIVTERGIIRPPFVKNIKNILSSP